MKIKHFLYSFLIIGLLASCKSNQTSSQLLDSAKNHKLVIYQMLPRLFGNINTNNKIYGTLQENGAGKFNDINDKALQEIKKLGVSHIWYTGIIEHATMTDYSRYGIKNDDPDVVKGKAGSPYAIKDYYDVDPDLAVNVSQRMQEFEALIKRTHASNLKLIIDFIPNHVSRTYHSDAKPKDVKDFGEEDDVSKAFSPKNDFYYIPNQQFKVPQGYQAGGANYANPLKDGLFNEKPAKATGNNVFKADPSLDDWFETIKLNYGVDVANKKNYFDPIPPVWFKTRDILTYWAKKGVDGFRCDVAEMVPVEFWAWVIPEVKKVNPDIIFIGEAYDPNKYESFINTGKFDYLYDKVGLYDALKRLIKNDSNATVNDIEHVIAQESVNISNHMLRFLENHDEERIASNAFAKDPLNAWPAMVVSATLGGGPVMIYFGQELGEPAKGIEGFGGEDGRTSIFDYWGVPNHQKWVNGGAFDGRKLNAEESKLRSNYQKLLNFSASNEAIKFGKTISLNALENQDKIFGKKVYAYLRVYQNSGVLVIANFDKVANFNQTFKLPQDIVNILKDNKSLTINNIYTQELLKIENIKTGLKVNVKPNEAQIYSFTLR
jgi:glycosidase